MKDFVPDYNNLIQAARNAHPNRLPLYDHNIDEPFISKYLGRNLAKLLQDGTANSIHEYFNAYCGFCREMGYDAVPFEYCIGPVMPGSGSLGGHKPGEIQNRKDFDNYPWERIEDVYFLKAGIYFEILREELPEGMKAVGGVGNGIFECVQDVVGYENLCMIAFDDPELYRLLFETVGKVSSGIWKRFLEQFADMYAVCRFGDDLGFKSSTLLSAEDIRTHIIPQYKRIVDIVHSYDKPFVLHSCGCIFDVIDDIIEVARIDAKHSNEDTIAMFDVWTEKYGDRIGNFGGIDMDVLCQKTEEEIRSYTFNLLEKTSQCSGVAYGSGNSIPHYVPVEGYLAMNKAIREFRGERL
jgi:uroporphyrinogen decarboxylase